MKIAIVLKTFPPDVIGGMETQTKRMATQLHNAGHEVTVFTKKFKDSTDSDVPYEVVRVRNWRLTPFMSDLTFLLFALIELVRRSRQFDLLQCMMLYPVGFLGYVVHKLTDLPYFAWIRGGDYYLMNDVRWKRWMMRRVLSDTFVLAQSTEIKTDVEADFCDLDTDIEVLGNGVEVPDEPRPDPNIKRVLYVGRFAPKKGLINLFDAIKQIDVDCELVLVGDGDQRDTLERRAEEVETDVQFEGFVLPSSVEKYYRKASVFVLPSTEGEGMPNVVLEAMSWGVPVVTTESGGLPSMITDGSTGYLVPMRDPAALRRKIETLLSNSSKRKEMGNAARQYVYENHSWEQNIDSLEQIYSDVIHSE
jgi:glycosyltransferase involved in cell wall biosynthesis